MYCFDYETGTIVSAKILLFLETFSPALMSKLAEGVQPLHFITEATMGEEVLIPITMFMLIGGIWGFTLLTRHRERMTMIEKGLKPEDMKALYERATLKINPLSSLKWGMIFVSVGIAALIGMYLHANYYVDEGIYPALMALLGGVGLIAFYLFASKKLQS